jgi:GT2 family glycosyltransferase
MTRPISVVVVSRHRPQALARCITALRQQDHPQIEVIVVADPAGIAALNGAQDLKLVPFDTANIAQARNLGVQVAAGQVVMFIDDDAVAEPSWASRLSAPFDNGAIVAATGFVRGRNGISYQWRAMMVDYLGQDHPLDVPDTISLHHGTAQMAVKTQGTNCAFRLDHLRAIGGFDPAFAFYLDEADVNLRLAQHGQTAVVPHAQVHHGYLASARRSDNRAPLSLFDIAASTAAFLRKHAPGGDFSAAYQTLLAQQTLRLARFLRARRLARRDIAPLLHTLSEGWESGLQRDIGGQSLNTVPAPFHPLQGTGPRDGCVIQGYSWQAGALRAKALRARDLGQIVTVICLAPSLRRHRMQFLPEGVWWQSGGLWGRSDRGKSALKPMGLRARALQETQILAPFRPV